MKLPSTPTQRRVRLSAQLRVDGETVALRGQGNGPVDASLKAIEIAAGADVTHGDLMFGLGVPIALGTALPLGVGAMIGGTANYGAVKALARNADRFFSRLPYSAIDTTASEIGPGR